MYDVWGDLNVAVSELFELYIPRIEEVGCATVASRLLDQQWFIRENRTELERCK
jgi:hypothetical protein